CIDGLCQIIDSSQFDCIDRGGDGSVPREDNDVRRRGLFEHPLQENQPRFIAELQVEHDSIDVAMLQVLERLGTAVRFEGVDTPMSKCTSEPASESIIVVDYQKRAKFFHESKLNRVQSTGNASRAIVPRPLLDEKSKLPPSRSNVSFER